MVNPAEGGDSEGPGLRIVSLLSLLDLLGPRRKGGVGEAGRGIVRVGYEVAATGGVRDRSQDRAAHHWGS